MVSTTLQFQQRQINFDLWLAEKQQKQEVNGKPKAPTSDPCPDNNFHSVISTRVYCLLKRRLNHNKLILFGSLIDVGSIKNVVVASLIDIVGFAMDQFDIIHQAPDQIAQLCVFRGFLDLFYCCAPDYLKGKLASYTSSQRNRSNPGFLAHHPSVCFHLVVDKKRIDKSDIGELLLYN